jgi:hypothetical protein
VTSAGLYKNYNFTREAIVERNKTYDVIGQWKVPYPAVFAGDQLEAVFHVICEYVGSHFEEFVGVGRSFLDGIVKVSKYSFLLILRPLLLKTYQYV